MITEQKPWPFWDITVTVETGNGSRRIWQWQRQQAATMESAMRGAPKWAAAQLRREGVKGRSNLRYMKVEASASMVQASVQNGGY